LRFVALMAAVDKGHVAHGLLRGAAPSSGARAWRSRTLRR
jgi:hypothetical protein